MNGWLILIHWAVLPVNGQGLGKNSYSKIVEMATKYFGTVGGETFHEKDFLAYGCFCNYQFSDKPVGHPVDGIDRACQAHRQCYQCAERRNPTSCKSKSWIRKSFGRKYKWRWISFTNGGGEMIFNTLKNSKDMCTRDIFECDKQLVKELFTNRYDWQTKWHFSNFDNREEDRCKEQPMNLIQMRGWKKKQRKEKERAEAAERAADVAGPATVVSNKRICCGGGPDNPFKLIPPEICSK